MSRERQRALNRAIADASPHAGFEAYANAYVEFYDADVSVTIGSREFVGRERVFDALVSLLARMESGFGRSGVRSRRIRLLGESEEENGALVSLWQLEVEQCVEGSTCFEWRSARK